MIRTGCCGWSESRAKYFQDFGVVEVQETFYQPGRIEKYEKWKQDAPPGFEFTVKAWQLITHEATSPTYRKLKSPVPDGKKNRYGSFRPTEEVFAAWEVVDLTARTLGAKIILFQTPPGFTPSPENKRNLRAFFSRIGRGEYLFCWEPRGDWQAAEVAGICSDLGLVHCTDPFKTKPVRGRIRYFRLHGLPGYNLRYRHTAGDLEALRAMIDRKRAYVLFNNLNMLQDARRFQRLVAQS